MLTFLFWNIQKKPLLHRIARLTTLHTVDVLILTECAAISDEVLKELNAGDGERFRYPFSATNRIKLFTRFPARRMTTSFNDSNNRVTIRKLAIPRRPPLLLCAIHLLSRNDTEPSDRAAFAQRVADDLRETENREGITRTILVGDFNMNPFDDPMVSGEVFHALMTKELATRRNERVIQCEKRRTFYNPMWEFLTDRGSRPSGTYYRHRSVPLNHFWHSFDQVLVRPELAGRLVGVEILETDGTDSLLTGDGWPDETSGSDHLPILFKLDW